MWWNHEFFNCLKITFAGKASSLSLVNSFEFHKNFSGKLLIGFTQELLLTNRICMKSQKNFLKLKSHKYSQVNFLMISFHTRTSFGQFYF